MRPAIWLAALTIALAGDALAQAGSGKKAIQCWTDKNGQRMCGDRVPPEYAGQQRDFIKDGRVVQTMRAAKTQEEIDAEERQKREAEEARKRAEYDRALLETYRSSKDIEAMRDERLVLIDGRLQAVAKNAADTEKSLAGLRARAEALKKDNKPVDEKLLKQIAQFERAQKQNEQALVRYRKEREDVEQRFNRDLTRYNELRLPRNPAPPGAAPPPPKPKPAASGSKSGG